METQGSLAIPGEHGGIKLISSTQRPTGVQRVIARILGLPMHKVEVEVLRLGGAFGGKGQPFGYHVIGTAITEVTLDCLRGTYEIDSVHAVYDGGIVLNPLIDRGQAEGGIVQGIGWLTLEELTYSDDGRLLSGTFSDYKVPDIYYAPEDIKIHFLEGSPNPIRFRSAYIGSVV